MPTIPSKFECKVCENDHCFIKKFCESQWVDLLSSTKHDRSIPKGTAIFQEGERVPGLYFIKKGKVKVTSSTVQGKEQIIRLAAPGDILGHRGVGDDTFPIGARTLEDSELCLIPNDVLDEIFIANPWLTVELMMFFSRELRKSEFRNKHLHHMNEREKVTLALLYIEDTFGQKGKVPTQIPLTREEIGQLSGTFPQDLDHELASLEKEGIIDGKAHNPVLHSPEKLRTIIRSYPAIF